MADWVRDCRLQREKKMRELQNAFESELNREKRRVKSVLLQGNDIIIEPMHLSQSIIEWLVAEGAKPNTLGTVVDSDGKILNKIKVDF